MYFVCKSYDFVKLLKGGSRMKLSNKSERVERLREYYLNNSPMSLNKGLKPW